MRSATRPAAALVVVLLALATPAWAARTALRHYTAADGLPQAQVTALVQDSAGYVWAGTVAGGVARYNGHRWDVFGTESGLPSASVTALAAGPGGAVYVGTSNGLVRFERGAWSRIALPDESRAPTVAALGVDGGGRLWIGTGRGLLVSTGGAAAQDAFAADPKARDRVITLTPDAAGDMWVGTASGLFRIGRDAAGLTPVDGVPAGRIWHVAVPSADAPVVSIADVGVFHRTAAGWRRLGDDAAPGRRVYVLLQDSEDPHALWMGTEDQGAFLARGARVEPFGRAEGLPDLHVNALMHDREGQLWFGTDSGIVKRGPSAFVTWTEADGLPPDVTVFGMAEGTDGSLWMAGFDDGVLQRRPDGKVKRYTMAEGLPAARVFDVAADPAGGAWASTRRGLVRIDAKGALSVPALPAGPPSLVYAMEVLADGTLVLGGEGGLAFVRGGRRQVVPGVESVDALDVAPDGTVWICDAGWGVGAVRDGQVVERLTTREGLPTDQATGVRLDADGGLWVATERGAWHRGPDGRTQLIDTKSGLPDRYVYWVGEDRARGLWFGTNRGVLHLPRGEPPDVYTTRDGLASDECNDDGFLVDRAGTVYIATIGVSRYTGRLRPHRAVDPPVVIEGFLVDGQETPPGVELGPDHGPVSVRFAALSFTDENATLFRYRMRGLSEEWSETRPGQRETTYGGLGAGRYVFEVLAVTSDGRTSGQPGAVAFTVRPRWWRTPAAAAVAALLLLVAVTVFVKMRERSLLAGRERLERTVAERTDALRQANQRLEELAVTDELTGLANRRRLTDGLASAIALARRQKTPLSVVIADLDRFKELNDTLGHEGGDRALVQAAQALKSGGLREVDLLGRWGGEEFLVVLPGSDEAGAREVGERLRKVIEQMGLVNEVTGNVLTTSVGVATHGDDVDSLAELVRRADQALYAAKAAGRNRVEAWTGEPKG